MSLPAIGAVRTRIRPTAAGRVLLPIALVSLFVSWVAGGITGLFAAMAITLIILAPLLSWLHLRGIAVRAPRPTRVTVGEPLSLDPILVNRSRTFVARDVIAWWSEKAGGDPRAGGLAHRIAPLEERALPVTHRLTKRGWERSLILTVTSIHPFGLVRCSRTFRVPVQVLGLPRRGLLRGLGPLRAGSVEEQVDRRRARAGEEEFYGVRDWREGESTHRMHWRSTAHRGRPITREFRVQAEAPLHVFLAASLPPGPRGFVERHPGFERAVSIAATLVERALKRGQTAQLSFAYHVGGKSSTRSYGGLRGRAGQYKALTVLSEVEAREGDPEVALRDAIASKLRREEAAVAVLVGAGDGRFDLGVRVLDVASDAIDGVYGVARPRGRGHRRRAVRIGP